MAFPMGKKYKFVKADIPALAPAEGTPFESLPAATLDIYISMLFEEAFGEDENFIFKYPVVKFIPLISDTDFAESAIDVSGAFGYIGDTGTENELYIVYGFCDTYKSDHIDTPVLPNLGTGNYIFYNPTDHSDYLQVPCGAEEFDFEGVKKYAPWPMEVTEGLG